MGTQATREHGLVISEQSESSPLLVTALRIKGAQVIIMLTLCEALARLEAETPPCLMVYRLALTTSEITFLRARCSWAKQVLFVVAASVPVPAALPHALEESKPSALSLFVSPKVSCRLVGTLTAQEEAR